MSLDRMLPLLEGVKRRGQGRWLALCPAHNDRSPSLALRELDDGRVLVHCFAGCDIHSILSRLAITFDDLYPSRELGHRLTREKRPFPATDILHAIAFEVLFVAVTASSILAGEPLNAADRERLALAVCRIHAALDAGGLNHE
ncbi:hypothetical protein SAMN05216404_108123 [Nitrosospira multiformis]|uniref:DNA primase n=1 Tax=Nitrosospira multiformis TaxID=1231 RepID=A0A1H8KF98_9PROT|nr:hypothetical protein [Nitrosospira multiformis]SEN91447.1 hypothetical protein SAMN05216404_108123 [Nitrosospira multiformis]